MSKPMSSHSTFGVFILDAAAILKKVQEKYLSFETYSDEGTVETPGQASLEFDTYFEKPDKFHFFWRAADLPLGQVAGKECDLCSNGETCYENLLDNSRQTTVAEGLADCAGMSGGSILMILNLLMPGVVRVNKFWLDMQNPVIKESTTLDAVDCYHIVGDSEGSGDIEAWIDSASFLVRRIRERMIITTQQAQAIRAEAVVALQAMGVAEDSLVMKEALAGFPLKEYSFDRTFNFDKIVVNAPLPDAIFDQ
jgi:hypothetical protein